MIMKTDYQENLRIGSMRISLPPIHGTTDVSGNGAAYHQ